jgi:hypothetical protein
MVSSAIDGPILMDRLDEIEKDWADTPPEFFNRHSPERGYAEDVYWLVAEVKRMRAALTEITELDLEGDASLADAIKIADEALHPPA